MTEESKVTRINLAVSNINENGIGVGATLYKKTDDGPEVFFIASLYYDKVEIPSIRRAIHVTFAEIIPHVPETDELIVILSTAKYFKRNIQEMKSKAKLYSGSKSVFVKHVQRLHGEALLLAQDAARRESSMSERLM